MRFAIGGGRAADEVLQRRRGKHREADARAGRSAPIDPLNYRSEHRIDIALARVRFAAKRTHRVGAHIARRAWRVDQSDRAAAEFRRFRSYGGGNLCGRIARELSDCNPRVAKSSVVWIEDCKVQEVFSDIYPGDWAVGADDAAGDSPPYRSRYSRRPPITFFT